MNPELAFVLRWKSLSSLVYAQAKGEKGHGCCVVLLLPCKTDDSTHKIISCITNKLCYCSEARGPCSAMLSIHVAGHIVIVRHRPSRSCFFCQHGQRIPQDPRDLQCCSRLLLTSLRRLGHGFSDVAFSPYGEQWRELRKICMLELFSTKKVSSFRLVREEEVQRMIDSISISSQ